MRLIAIAADLFMGLLLGIFLYVVCTRLWPALAGPVTIAVIVGGAVALVLFRRPGGSLARRGKARPVR